ncbi:PREDICTED: DNA polymerase alpha catalytic subunit [Ceratosolen solmsi marchali]|uniref:DNA polymerase n=1 Tax=Ceratosolen solmsi marchali TaxID=326594 RepID=A0AAJ7E2C3_9HYME|nr:PREDICTED: DNA polymerase alpha catalytic subunit [Ceratosolen solmsi marchali]
MDDTIASRRSKRQKIDKSGRLLALEKFKKLKGSKNKYDDDELENVYDEVDEEAYNKLVLDRQYDDWIVDDGGGSGYVEDGREIFDDDLDDESVRQAAKREYIKGPRKRKRDVNAMKNDGSIVSMFSSMSSKKKAEEKICDDDILGDLMSELKKDTNTIKTKDKPRTNKFLSSNKPSVSEDDKLLASLTKPVISAKTILDELNDEILYDKPERKSNNSKVCKSATILDEPEVTRKEKVEEIKQSPIKAKNVTIEDNFVTLDKEDEGFSNINEISVNENKDDMINDDNLNQYVGDISDIDFASASMDTKIPELQNKSEMWKEKDAESCKDGIKVWQEDFNIACGDAAPGLRSEKKSLPLPTTVNAAGDTVFRFFWWDAFEDPYKHPGQVYLFGKVYITSLNDYVSCCVNIKNIPKRIYLLPREYIKKSEHSEENKESNTMMNVYNEFNDYARTLGIQEFRCIEVTKNYAFERADTPQMAEYLEVRYASTYPAVDADFNSPSIEAVFGMSINPLELFLIERNIKGPCWLDVKMPLSVNNAFSWSTIEVNCTKMENISVTMEQTNTMTIPPIVIATINVQVCLDSKQQKNEIVNIGILLHHKFELDKTAPKPPFNQHFCLVTHPRNINWPLKARDRLAKITQTKVIRCDTELDLLQQFLDIIQCSDPDIIIGYDCGFQFDVLMNRIYTLKVKNWSIVGKLKRLTPPSLKGKMNLNQVFCGRPICDIMKSAKELNLKVRSYDLASLCVSVLNKKEYECKEIKPEDCPMFYSSFEKLENLIKSTMVEASYILNIVIELNILPLALQITNIAGNTLSRTLSAGRAERNEFLLLHAFHNKGYITPDKRMSNKKKNDGELIAAHEGKKKPAYAGGLVLQPKKGFYDKLILLMDFNSLYPSIIQEFNLCFTTVPGAAYADVEDLCLPESSVENGIVPTEIRKLVESRIQVKNLLKTPNLSPELKIQYNIRQLALKLTANSMYGCLGATHCRFYAKGLAALITMKGREILQNTKALVEKFNYEVIYGDTDSIMINTNILEYDQVFNIGREIKKEVNKTYKKVELDIDGVFKYLLLLQKKKYAAVTMTKLPNGQIHNSKELKGLDIVRRDWCGLACDIGNQILDQLLCDQLNELRLENIFDILKNIGDNLREGKLPLSSLVITKQLSKNPNDYPSDKKLSHVLVALRLNESGSRKWKAGDTVPYIICEDGTNKTAVERAYHIEEFKKNDILKVDVNYYLLNQIHPVVLRICEPIEGIDDVLIAQHLGIKDFYKPKRIFINEEENEIPVCIQDDRYAKCQPFSFICRNKECKTENNIKTAVTEFNGFLRPSLAMCSNPDCNLPPWKSVHAIQNKLQIDIRNFITNYYYAEVECENPICSKVMRRIMMDTLGKLPKCYSCHDGNVHKIHKETELYNQLSFYLSIFTLNLNQYKNVKLLSSQLIDAYDTLKEFVEKQIQYNAYSVVDLTKLFWPKMKEQNLDNTNSLEEVPSIIEVENLIQEELESEDVSIILYKIFYRNIEGYSTINNV